MRISTGIAGRLLVAGALVLAISCGKKGPPRPPEPRGPLPPEKIEVRQVGPTVLVGFVAPSPRSDKPSQQILRAELVRVSYTAGNEPPPDPGAFRRRGELAQTLYGDPLDSGERLIFADEGWKGPGGETDQLLRYAVRIRDRRGRPSSLVAARDLAAVAVVAPPEDLVAEPTADGIRLTWSAPPSDEVPRFNIYRTDQGRPVGWTPVNPEPLTATEYLDRTVTVGETYVFEVRTAISLTPPFRESESSNRIELVAEDRFAPAVPAGLVVVQEGPAVRLFWDPNQERDLSGYRIYRKPENGDWERIGPDPVGEPLYLDTLVEPGDYLLYRIAAVDRARPPNESPPSAEVEVDVVEDPGETVLPEGP
jgi:hypothetical protein